MPTRSSISLMKRRVFLGYGAGVLSLPGAKAGPNERPTLGAVGVGGKGWADSLGASRHGEIVAFCDVDELGNKRRGGFVEAAKKWPKAKRYTDWREMLEKEKLDGVTVSTPDHMHAPVTMTALKLGISPYTQKPLTRTVHEARALTLAAREAKVATQMGNQNHSGVNYKGLVDLVRAGHLGKIERAYAWSNRPIWPQGHQRPNGSSKIPDGLHWDLWLGVAPKRPFLKEIYHPFAWRGWYDFGAGALGDMGCHIIDPVVWALELGPARSVKHEGPAPMKETFPEWERIHYDFAGTKYTSGENFQMIWYDGNQKPTAEEAGFPPETKIPDNGVILVGEKASLITKHGSSHLPDFYVDGKKISYPLEKPEGDDHYGQWVSAIRGEGTPASNFDYSGPMTETVLLGTIACRFPGQILRWNSDKLKFLNSPEANTLIRQTYRKGWEIEGL